MYTTDIQVTKLAKLISISWFPLAIRDVGFRTIMLSFYYLTTDIQHKPLLKYTIP